MRDWLKMTAADLGRGIGAGKIDAVALTETYLDAIAGHEVTPRIYARLTESRARAEAEAAQARAAAGQRRSVLDGVPISWKDLFDTAGVGTEAGSALLKGRVPEHDARVLRNATTAAGTVCLGKTHMSELAFSGLGFNPVTATPPCVNDPEAVAGGSSSGAATSVAFGLAAAGIGSDTGGSVRAPAVWNDLVGLKTTPGRLSLEGVVPLITSFDTVGPLTRSVEDAALLLSAMEPGPAPDLRGASLSGARFAVLETLALEDLEDAPARAFDAALSRLSAAGAKIERITVPAVRDAMEVSAMLYTGEAYGEWRDAIEAQPDVMFAEIRDRFRMGASFSASDFAGGWKRLERARTDWEKATAGYDAVLTPTVPILPPNLKRLNEDSAYYVRVNLLALRNTRIGNLMGLCALTLPAGVPSCGITLMTTPGDDIRLLRLGAAAEAALA